MNELTRQKIEEYYENLSVYNEDMRNTTWFIPCLAQQPDFSLKPFKKPSELIEWAIETDVGFNKGTTFTNGKDCFGMRGLMKIFYRGKGDLNNDYDYDMISRNMYKYDYDMLEPRERVDIIQTIKNIDQMNADCFKDYLEFFKSRDL